MFKNRREAGRLLGMELEIYRDQKPVVLAIPRGGVEVGIEVAKLLDCEFTVVIARKLGYLRQPEAAFGAIAEDGSLYLSPVASRRLDKEEIEVVIKKEEIEIKRRVRKYREREPLIALKNRVLIIVDDGIATGSTLFAVIELCKKQKPEKIVVASPVSNSEVIKSISTKVDDVIILDVPQDFYAVSQAYEKFPAHNDKKVKKLIDEWRTGSKFNESMPH